VVSGRRPAPPQRARPSSGAAAPPLGDREIDELQALLDRVPAPFEALDVSSLDGFLCGVLVQPQQIAPARWRPFVTDSDGRALPAAFDARRLFTLVERRAAELHSAIGRRAWFDPWVFELAGEEADVNDGATAATGDAVFPWVAGFAAALETFPGLLAYDEADLIGPLALLYRHLDADDLDDAEALLAEIESLEPPADLTAAVEEIVRATLLLADVAGVGQGR
jgi:uncharacterized protein